MTAADAGGSIKVQPSVRLLAGGHRATDRPELLLQTLQQKLLLGLGTLNSLIRFRSAQTASEARNYAVTIGGVRVREAVWRHDLITRAECKSGSLTVQFGLLPKRSIGLPGVLCSQSRAAKRSRYHNTSIF